MADFTCNNIRKHGNWDNAFEEVVLTYDERFLRRRVVTTLHRHALLVDLEHTTSVGDGDAFELTDGRFISCVAAEEDLLRVEGDLVRLAWHIGNRHMPCAIYEDRLLIQNNHVMADMLEKLGAKATPVRRQFFPEGGAYGHGRTMGHSHGKTAHDHQH